MSTVLMIFLIFSCLFSLSMCRSVFVSSTKGSDKSGCGTPTAPCLSLAFAITNASASGDVIALAATEVFSIVSTTISHNLTISSTDPSSGSRAFLRDATSLAQSDPCLLFVTGPNVTFGMNNVHLSGALNQVLICLNASAALDVTNCTFANVDLFGESFFLVNPGNEGGNDDDDDVVGAQQISFRSVEFRNVTLHCPNETTHVLIEGYLPQSLNSNVSLVDISISDVSVSNHTDCEIFQISPMMSFAWSVFVVNSSAVLFKNVSIDSVPNLPSSIVMHGQSTVHVSDVSTALPLAFEIHGSEMQEILIENSRFCGGSSIWPMISVVEDLSLFHGNHDQSTAVTENSLGNLVISVRNTTFRNNSNGAAIIMTASESQFDNCLFESNVAADRSPMVIANGADSMRGGSNQITVRNCCFVNNGITSQVSRAGGAILVDDQDVNLTVLHSTFVDNFAPRGSQIAVLGVRAPTFASFPMIVLSNTTFRVADASVADDAWLDMGMIFMERAQLLMNDSCTVVGSGPLATLTVDVNDPTLGGFGVSPLQDAAMSCLPGSFVIAHQANDSVGGETFVSWTQAISVRCSPCLGNTYNMGLQTINFADGAASRNQSVGCFPCAPGSRFNCSGSSVGSSMGFWAFLPDTTDINNTTTLAFVKCPAQFCCEEELGCSAPNHCSGNRSGVLCGACKDGYTHAFSAASVCVEMSTCSPTRVGIGNAIVVTACLGLTMYMLQRTKTTSDGMQKVIFAFVNTASVVLSEFRSRDGANAFTDATATAVSLSSGIVLPHAGVLTYCPARQLSSLQRLMVTAIVPAILFACWCLVSMVVVVFGARRRHRGAEARQLLSDDWDDDDSNEAKRDDSDAGGGAAPADVVHQRSAAYRICAAFISLFDLSLFVIVSSCVSLLNTIDVPGLGCRLWKAGDVECDAGIRAGAWFGIVVVLMLPVLFAAWRRFRPSTAFSLAVEHVNQSPMRAGVPWYNNVLIIRRFAIAVAFSLCQDADLRALLIRAILMIGFAVHMQLLPFVSVAVNRMESISLLSLLLATSLQATAGSAIEGRVITILQTTLMTVVFFLLFGFVLYDKGTRFCNRESNKPAQPGMLTPNATLPLAENRWTKNVNEDR